MRKIRSKPLTQAIWLAFGTATALTALPALSQDRVVVTGSRILKSDLQAASPTQTVTEAEIVGRQDVTLDTILNTLPQVNPAGTTTSNNPGNGGQSNIDLRGLGSNRNLVLLDGRRPMVSASDQTVDLNTIPLALIDNIEIITGGAGAVYGADAVSGVVNIKLKRRFDGVAVAAGISNAADKRDAREERFSLLLGNNFDGNRGNAAFYVDTTNRQTLIKGQRAFAAVATSTTSFFPEGTYRPTGNNPTQAAVDALYSQNSYRQPLPGQTTNVSGGLVNYTSGDVPAGSVHSFNTDGTLIYPGIFNSPRDVRNWRYPVDSGVNTNIFPDAYSYNFDAVNILVLPLKRYSMGGKFDFAFDNGTEIFGRLSQTVYTAKQALAPSPVPTIRVARTGEATAGQAESSLVESGQSTPNNLIVPVTNPFIPADLAALLASRSTTGNQTAIVGSGPTEPFQMRWRTLGAGLRESKFDNDVFQLMLGAKGDIGKTGWAWETSGSYGKTQITQAQSGNIDTNKLQRALEAADGGASLCAGGINPFGRQALSASCAQFLNVNSETVTTLNQRILQGFVTGDIAKLPAGALSAVVGAEYRGFQYDFDPGSVSGPISGFNVQSAASGKNNFVDVFGELQIPVLRRAPLAQSLDISLAARTSQSEFEDLEKQVKGDKQRSNTFAFNLTWSPVADIRARASLQRAVRAPNFSELFDGGGSAPQYFDPCSATSAGRTTGNNAALLTALCARVDAAGVPLAGNYVQTPGTQASVTVEGNTALKPETGNSVTLGLVFAPQQGGLRGFSASVDYYQIEVKNAITSPDTNEIIADCYNYYGRNPTYANGANDPTPGLAGTIGPGAKYCGGVFRGGGDILFVDNPDTASGAFAGSNGGRIKTSGLDFALGWRGKLGPGEFSVGLNLTHLLSYKLKTADFLPEKEFKGTIPYFGAGLGQAFPENKLVFNTGYDFGMVAVDARYRWFSAMSNRMELMFPGEKFTGTAATGYLDLGVSVEPFKGVTLRAGVNNVMDQEARTYSPNVQSGTDPSSFDVIGRRYILQMNAKF